MFEILTDPNVAYLLLLTGLWLGLLAVMAPGTGLFELGAIFALLLAGWGVYNHPLNGWALALLVLVALPLMFLVFRTGNLLFLALSIVALIVGSSYLFQGQGWLPAVNPVLALVASTASAGFFWVVVQKTIESRRIKPSHELLDLVGSIGETRTPVAQFGTVHVDGELWSARSAQPVAEGMPVRIVGHDGFTLLVEPLPSNGPENSPNPDAVMVR